MAIDIHPRSIARSNIASGTLKTFFIPARETSAKIEEKSFRLLILSLRVSRALVTLVSLLSFASLALSQTKPLDFSGTWSIDLRSSVERAQKTECGFATFVISQAGDSITGNHYMATAGCGRFNDGGEETVKGVVIGSTAVLVVTSSRNDAIVLGVATLRNGKLVWRTRDDIKAGSPEGDSALILSQGILSRRN
jgi:hypothetical protein